LLGFCLNFRKQQLEYLKQEKNFKVSGNIDFIHLKPEKRLKLVAWSNSKKKLEKIFNQGYKNILNNKNILYYFFYVNI